MKRVVVLDSGPLSFITSTKGSQTNTDCTAWVTALLKNGDIVILPEIADYEVRRGLLRVKQIAEIAKLEELKHVLKYAPITTEVMVKAAEFWAQSRLAGRKTADDTDLDGDVILAAQATFVRHFGDHVIIATTNVKHLTQFGDAQLWQNIPVSPAH